MNSNFRWHHVGEPDNEWPKPGNDLIVRCANGEFLKAFLETDYEYFFQTEVCRGSL